MDGVIVLIELVVASIWIMQGFTYGFWKKGRPGGGFLGVIFGVLILIIALVMGIRMLIKRDFGKKNQTTYYCFFPYFHGRGRSNPFLSRWLYYRAFCFSSRLATLHQ